jgi:hypothetical protein
MSKNVPLSVLVTHRGDRLGTPDGQQLRGLLMARREIESRVPCALSFVEAREVDQIRTAVRDHAPDALVMFPEWRWSADTAKSLCTELMASGIRVIFLDYYATANSPHFGVVPHVETYIKRQLLRDRSAYDRPLIGGTPLTDYLHKNLGFDCADWGFRSRIDPAYLHNVVVGWNLGACERYLDLCRRTAPLAWAWRARPFHLHARLGLFRNRPTKEWYEYYRAHCIEAVRRLPRRVRMPGFDRVGVRRYYAELLLSRTVLSPFGWGEVCFRDYEAVACGCLLLKPSMDHLETEPDIYRAGTTYVPLKWDLSDLEEKLAWIASHPREAAAIVREAQRVLVAYFEENRLASFVTSVLLKQPDASAHSA